MDQYLTPTADIFYVLVHKMFFVHVEIPLISYVGLT